MQHKSQQKKKNSNRSHLNGMNYCKTGKNLVHYSQICGTKTNYCAQTCVPFANRRSTLRFATSITRMKTFLLLIQHLCLNHLYYCLLPKHENCSIPSQSNLEVISLSLYTDLPLEENLVFCKIHIHHISPLYLSDLIHTSSKFHWTKHLDLLQISSW